MKKKNRLKKLVISIISVLLLLIVLLVGMIKLVDSRTFQFFGGLVQHVNTNQ